MNALQELEGNPAQLSGEAADRLAGLTRPEAHSLSGLYLAKLHEQPDLFPGSQQLITNLHWLAGPLEFLPEGVSQTEARGIFRPYLRLRRRKSDGQITDVLPHYRDIPVIMEAFCQKIDDTLDTLHQAEKEGYDAKSARFDLATWAYMMMTGFTCPFLGGDERVARNLFRYILGSDRTVNFPQHGDSDSVVFSSQSEDQGSLPITCSSIGECLGHIIIGFKATRSLEPGSDGYFENLKKALLTYIENSRLEMDFGGYFGHLPDSGLDLADALLGEGFLSALKQALQEIIAPPLFIPFSSPPSRGTARQPQQT